MNSPKESKMGSHLPQPSSAIIQKDNFSPGRIGWIDYAKGLGIFLVVVGHTFRGLEDVVFEPSILTVTLDRWIYAFHMPLFFFLTGLFIERAASKPFSIVFKNWLRTIVYPYIIWSTLQEVIRFAAGIRTAPITDLWRIVYDPPLQFWFLYSLLLLSLAYVSLRKIRFSILAIATMSVLLFVASSIGLNLGQWPVTHYVSFYGIYFTLGALAQTHRLLQRLDGYRPLLLWVGAMTGFGAVALAVSLNLGSAVPEKLGLALVGIGASLALAHYLETARSFTAIRTWGVLSLEIFVAHTIFSATARVVLQKLFGINSIQIHVLVGCVVGIYGPILLCQFGQRMNFAYLFRFPVAKSKVA